MVDMRRRTRGFTLAEVLLVVVIIGILAGVLATRLSGRSEEARIGTAKASIKGALSLSLDLFEQDVGRFPTTEEGLEALVTDPGVSGWKGPYLKTELKPDPWETPFSYVADSEDSTRYVLSSAGPDRQIGTEDDILP